MTDELNSDGDCSLREAVETVNDGSSNDACETPVVGPDTIVIPTAGNYTLSRAGAAEDLNATGDLDVLSDMIITETAPSGTTNIQAGTTGGNSGDGIDRVFHARLGADLTLENLTVRYGRVIGDGGGIFADTGDVTMSNVSLVDNRTSGNQPNQRGGGIYVDGALSLTTVFIEDNQSGRHGGGIYKAGAGALSITNESRLSGNKANSPASGGALYLAEGSATLSATEITSNSTANSSGGGIYHCSSGTVTMTDMLFESNAAGGPYAGGALNSCSTAGNVTIDDSNFTSNSATQGGALWHENSTLDIDSSRFFNNQATGVHGGAIRVLTGTLSIDQTSFDGNTAGASGGAIASNSGVEVDVGQSSFSNNTAGAGGAISNLGTMWIGFSTLSGNTSTDSNYGANVADFDSTTPSSTQIEGSILGNPLGGPSCTGTITSLGDNLVEEPGTCEFTATSDQTGDPGLTTFGDHGGPTPTFGLLASSLALDTYEGSACPSVDQRDYSRPADGPDDDTTPTCDVGAYEARTVTVDDEEIIEGDPPGTAEMSFQMTLSAPAPEPVRIDIELVHGTTDASDITTCHYGVDLPGCNSAIVVPTNQTSVTYVVKIAGDNLDESDEDFTLNLSSPELLVETPEVEGLINDDDEGEQVLPHARSVTLNLRRHLKAKGRLTVADTFSACRKQMPVKVQKRKKTGGWKTLATPITSNLGYYKTSIPDKKGRYRALAPKRRLDIDGAGHSCGRRTSLSKSHKH